MNLCSLNYSQYSYDFLYSSMTQLSNDFLAFPLFSIPCEKQYLFPNIEMAIESALIEHEKEQEKRFLLLQLQNSDFVEQKSVSVSVPVKHKRETKSSIKSRESPKECEKKNKRFLWNQEMHEKFVSIVDAIGIESVTPKIILSHMKVKDLKRKHIKSHLQSYRQTFKRITV